MNQDPITTRFLEAYKWLCDEAIVRSARQFALSLDTYPQSFNDIKKGRREATLGMVKKIVEVYQVNADYLLSGRGSIIKNVKMGYSDSDTTEVTFVQAHQFDLYATLVAESAEPIQFVKWKMPGELMGSNIEIAFQCNTDRISSCLGKGDILFSRKVPRESWKSNLSSKRVYVFVVSNSIHIVKIRDVNSEGVWIQSDDRPVQEYFEFEHISEIWTPISKWSNKVVVDPLSLESKSVLDTTLQEQNERIKSLNSTLEKWMQNQQLHSQV